MTRRSTTVAPPDGGYGWVVVGASFMLYVCAAGPFMSLGVFIVEWSDYFNTTKAALGWIGALLGCGSLAGVLLGPLSRRYGCRVVGLAGSLFNLSGFALCFLAPNVSFLLFSYGFLTGLGNACFTITATVGVQLYFVKRRALASSMAVTGTAAGVFLWPPFARLLMDIFAWKGACLIIAAILFNGAVFCTLITPLPHVTKHKLPKKSKDWETVDKSQEEEAELSPKEAVNSQKKRLAVPGWCTYRVYLLDIVYCAGFWFIYGGHLVILTFTPIRADYLGFSKHEGAWLVSICGIASGTLRVFVGWLGDRKCVNRTMLQGSGGLLAASLTLGSLFIKSFILLAVYEGFYGAATAIFVALHGSVIVDVFSISRVDLGVGMTMVSSGLAGFCVLPLAGRLLDMTKNPNVPYALFSIWQMIGGILVAFVVPFLKKYIYSNGSATPKHTSIVEDGKEEIEKLSHHTDLTPLESQPCLQKTLGENEMNETKA